MSLVPTSGLYKPLAKMSLVPISGQYKSLLKSQLNSNYEDVCFVNAISSPKHIVDKMHPIRNNIKNRTCFITDQNDIFPENE